MDFIKHKHRIRVKLMFNPASGKHKLSSNQLMDIIQQMQKYRLMPEPFIFEPGRLQHEVEEALASGIRLFVVCGGDGTVSTVARALLGTTATLGIIPIGTRNNIALSLGIPTNIPAAIELLRTGKRVKIDLGISTCGGVETPFIELCSVGLFSALFEAGEEIRHGKISRLGDFLANFISSPQSDIQLVLDDKTEILHPGHVVLINNMPYISLNYRVGKKDAYCDGLLDVLLFADLSKIDLIGVVLKGSHLGRDINDPRIRRFSVKRIKINTSPPMPIMADSTAIGSGSVTVEIRKKALTVIAMG